MMNGDTSHSPRHGGSGTGAPHRAAPRYAQTTRAQGTPAWAVHADNDGDDAGNNAGNAAGMTGIAGGAKRPGADAGNRAGSVTGGDRRGGASHAGGPSRFVDRIRAITRREAMLTGLAILALIAFVSAGVFLSDKTTLLIRDSGAPAGYLPVSEYSLAQPSTGKPVASIRTGKYSQFTILDDNDAGARCSVNKHGCDHALVTSRGIRPGSGWNDFVLAYGDVTAYEIRVDANDDGDYYKSYMSDEDRRAEESVREHRGITVAAFDRDYVRAGKVDPTANRVTVTFRAGYQSGNVLYTAADQWQGYLNSIEKRRWHVGRQYGELSGPAIQYFTLEFDFGNRTVWEGLSEGGVISISSSLYN